MRAKSSHRVPYPDAGLGRELLHEGAAIGRESQGDAKGLAVAVLVGRAGEQFLGLNLDALRVTLGLLQDGRDVLGGSLGLDDGDAAPFEEELVGVRVQLARAVGNVELRLDALRAASSE
jgi:hypothetical protein